MIINKKNFFVVTSILVSVFFLSCFFAFKKMNDNELAAATSAETIALSSDANQNKTRYIKLGQYPLDYLPEREAGGCVKSGVTSKKTLPWLADTQRLGPYDHLTDLNYDGNNMYQSSDCDDRYKDGGGSSLQTRSNGQPNTSWIAPDEYGGWARHGSLDWGNATLLRPPDSDKCLIHNDGVYGPLCTHLFSEGPLVWGHDDFITADQAYGSNNLFGRNGWTNEPQKRDDVDVLLRSSGTTLFRNEFSLTQNQIDRIDTISFSAKADDFMRVYVNGAATGVQFRTPNDGINVADSSAIKSALRVGDNVIAFQVNDKATWSTNMPGEWTKKSSHAVGLWYELRINLSSEPPENGNGEDPDSPSLSCTVEPTRGEDPLNVKVTTTSSNFTPDSEGFGYKFDKVDGPEETIEGRADSIIFPLPGAGKYKVSVSNTNYHDGEVWRPCDPTEVFVTDPRGGTGGEVAP